MPKFLRLSEAVVNVTEIAYLRPAAAGAANGVLHFTSGEQLTLNAADAKLVEQFLNADAEREQS